MLVREKVRTSLKKVVKGEFAFFVLPELEKEKLKEIILKDLLKKYKRGLYVSFESSIKEVNSFLNKNKFRALQGVAKRDKKEPQSPEFTFDEELSRTEISMLIQKLTSSGKYNFIVFDSPQTILMRYSLYESANFINYLIAHSKLKNLVGVGIGSDCETTTLLIPKISEENRTFIFQQTQKTEITEARLIDDDTRQVYESLLQTQRKPLQSNTKKIYFKIQNISIALFAITLIISGFILSRENPITSLSPNKDISPTLIGALVENIPQIMIIAGFIALAVYFFKTAREINN